MRSARLLALPLLLSACHAETPVTTPSETAAVATQPASRRLAAETTFAELVGRARSIEATGDAETAARCVLGVRAGGITLDASVLPAMRPLPDAQDGLDARLMQGEQVRVLSRWGQAGDGTLALVTFTPTAPVDRGSLVVVITPRGLFLRRVGEALPDRARGAWALDRLREAIVSLELPRGSTLVVTADASMAMSTVADVLGRLAVLDVHAVLAVPLPQGTPVPEEPIPPPPTDAALCEALPELPETAPLGEVRVDEVRRAAAALSDIALACARSSSSAAVARGGRVDLFLRIDASGRVTHACPRADAVHDDAYRECLLGAARRLTFPAPSPPGFVDVAVPVRLLPDADSSLTAVCTDAP